MAAFGEKSLFGSLGAFSEGSTSSVATRRGIALNPLHQIQAHEGDGAYASSPDGSLSLGSVRSEGAGATRRFSHFLPRPQMDEDMLESQRTRSFDGADAIKKIIRKYEQNSPSVASTVTTIARESPSSSMETPMTCPARMTWHRPPLQTASPSGVHPLVAVLRGMRNRGADNMAYAMAMSQRAEETRSDAASKDEEGHGMYFNAPPSATSPGTNKTMPENMSADDIFERTASSSSTASLASSPGKTPKLQKKREMDKVSVDVMYNIIVDGTAGHVLLDTRCESVFMEGHIVHSMGVKQACEKRGKHFVLVSETGEMMAREWHAVSELEKTEGALSIKVLDGGFGAFEENYPFLCERSGATAAEEMEKKRGANRRWLPSRITKHLFIGGKECAEDVDTCRRLRIDHILSILMDPRAVRVPSGVLHLPLSIEDEAHEDISVFFEQSYRWIDAAIKSGCRVLVHCKVGRCRSATICVVYLMRSRGLSLDDALKLMKSCRRQVHINHGFLKQLRAYEIKLFGSPGVGGVPRVPPAN